AELHDLGARVEDRCVPGTDVVRVAGLEQLLLAARAEADLALDDVSHVLALALVVREPLEERGEVGVLRVRLEADRPAAVEVLEVALVALDRLVLGSALLGCLWHDLLLSLRLLRVAREDVQLADDAPALELEHGV